MSASGLFSVLHRHLLIMHLISVKRYAVVFVETVDGILTRKTIRNIQDSGSFPSHFLHLLLNLVEEKSKFSGDRGLDSRQLRWICLTGGLI